MKKTGPGSLVPRPPSLVTRHPSPVHLFPSADDTVSFSLAPNAFIYIESRFTRRNSPMVMP